jgi:hypothetical protein
LFGSELHLLIGKAARGRPLVAIESGISIGDKWALNRTFSADFYSRSRS